MSPQKNTDFDRGSLPSVVKTRGKETGSRGQVIIIDDDPEILSSLSDLLALENYSCETYISAYSYLQVLITNQMRFSDPVCVICDVKMPLVDGLEFQQRLLSHYKIPLVLMSGESGVNEAVSAFRSGVVDFLIKPFDADTLFSVIEKALLISEEQKNACDSEDVYYERIKSLTEREREVLRSVAAGQLNREIADTMGIALRTVKLYRHRALEKLGLEKVVDLARIADRYDL